MPTRDRTGEHGGELARAAARARLGVSSTMRLPLDRRAFLGGAVAAGAGVLAAKAALREEVWAAVAVPGVARFPADGTTADTLIGSARRALEAARTGGPGGLATAAAATPPGD